MKRFTLKNSLAAFFIWLCLILMWPGSYLMQACGQCYGCGQNPTATPTATATGGTPTATATSTTLPSGVPTPPAIPAIPHTPFASPAATVAPGATPFGGPAIHGDGVSDDTAGIQAALNAGSIYVTAATYAIAGSITIPTGRNIWCNSGAILLNNQISNHRMFQIGYSGGSNGNNAIIGCTLQGTDSAADYSTYGGGYSELLEITAGFGPHPDNVLIENNTFLNAQGDSFIVYSPCGTANTASGPCNNGPPGTEGPSHIFLVNNTISHCSQPGIHLNGGQNLVITGNTVTDCDTDDEVDANTLQLISSWWSANTFLASLGHPCSAFGCLPNHSCTGNDHLAEDDSRCYQYNETISGVATGGCGSCGPSVLKEPAQGTCPGAFIPGHYVNETVINGATLKTGC